MASQEETTPTNWAKVLSILLLLGMGVILIILWILWNRYNDINRDVLGLKVEPMVSAAKKLELNGTVISLGDDGGVDLALLIGTAGSAGGSGSKGTTGATGAAGAAGSVGVATAQNGVYLSGTTLEFGTNPLVHATTLDQNGNDLMINEELGGNFIIMGTPDSVGGGTGPATVAPNHDYFMLFPDKAASVLGYLNDGSGGGGILEGRPTWWPVTAGTEWDNANVGGLSIGIGINTLTPGIASVNIGQTNAIGGLFNIALGSFNSVGLSSAGYGNVVIGSSSIVEGTFNMILEQAVGSDCSNINGNTNFMVGACNDVVGNSNFGLGLNNDFSGSTGFSVGYYNFLSGSSGFAIGGNNIITDQYVFGLSNTLTGGSSNMALGFGVASDVNANSSIGIATQGGLTLNSLSSLGLNVGSDAVSMDHNNVIGLFGGNVGVNTEDPTYRFHVSDATTDTTAAFTGTTQTCIVDTSGPGGWNCTSDQRLKENIVSLDGSLDKLLQLQGVTYNFKANPDGSPIAGFIAQEVQKILPDLVGKDPNGYLNLNKEGMIPYIVEAIKTQNGKLDDTNTALLAQGVKVDSLGTDLTKLTNRVDTLESEVQDLKTRLNALENPATPVTPATTP